MKRFSYYLLISIIIFLFLYCRNTKTNEQEAPIKSTQQEAHEREKNDEPIDKLIPTAKQEF